MVKEDDLEAGRPQVLLFLAELVSSGGSEPSDPTLEELALLFLQAFSTFCLLIASTEFFLSTLGLTSLTSLVFLLLPDLSLWPVLGEVGGVQLRQESEDLPLETALSLSESSSRTPLELSSEFFFPMGGLEAGWE